MNFREELSPKISLIYYWKSSYYIVMRRMNKYNFINIHYFIILQKRIMNFREELSPKNSNAKLTNE